MTGGPPTITLLYKKSHILWLNFPHAGGPENQNAVTVVAGIAPSTFEQRTDQERMTLPEPEEIMFIDVFTLIAERWDFFFSLLLQHLAIAGSAAFFACVLGISLGIFISEFAKTAPVVIQVSNIIYTIPAISMLGFLIPLTGIGNTTAVVALAVYGLLPMIGNTYTGIKSIDPDIIEAARGMGSSRFQLLCRIKIPLALPVIITAFRTMLVMTIALAGIASFIGAGGLGVAIYRGITTNNTAMTLAGSLLIALIAFMADGLCALAEKNIPWKRG